ncbi:GNAT family N-acetyltransferase [Amycolatopsis sp. YIM 10]|uniref:GNAT family N-acetyltransferase n=1 Tax=Amycolatopsis sp. YIM 10 TaxID=2653857 RepID=UPI00128FF492|nr:GNAT family N-acetyltransferase [Amycolatopsis sp. YIM 10]QFU93010.1 Acetyltransferase (GNAT) family protein [Amycolatopsis sp. YIM 10]
MDEIITYLEMTAPGDLRPAGPVDGLVLDPVGRTSPLIRELHARVGAPHGWSSATRTDAGWDEWLAKEDREYRVIRFDGEAAGATDYVPQDGGDVEISTFGLLPEFVGRGLGGYALTLVVQEAWAVPGARRVWLHTSTKDHPNAMPNYLRRGFRIFEPHK